MTLYQWKKLGIKIVLILPVVKNGVFAIIRAYREQNDELEPHDLFNQK